MKPPVLALLALVSMAPAMAQDPKPDFSLQGAANASVARRASTFGGSVIVTPDEDWRTRWNEARGVVPRFTEATSIPRGKKVWVLIFFTNARADLGGQVNVLCDLKFIKPDGTTAHEQKGLACYRGRIEGSPGNLRLATQQIQFVGEPRDPTGTWRVEVRMKDANGNQEVPLIAVFTLRA